MILKPFSKFTIWWTLRTPCYEQPRATDENLCYGSKSVCVVTLLCYRVADDSSACQPPQITGKCPVLLPVGDIWPCHRTGLKGMWSADWKTRDLGFGHQVILVLERISFWKISLSVLQPVACSSQHFESSFQSILHPVHYITSYDSHILLIHVTHTKVQYYYGGKYAIDIGNPLGEGREGQNWKK